MKTINIFLCSKILLLTELAAQLVVVVTEAVSNSLYRKFPPSAIMMGYTGQSLLVIIVAILIMLMTILVLRNLGRIIVRTSWKISISCMGFSLASVAFRVFSAWFVVKPSDEYYIPTYNITSYFIIIGAVLWIPFIFCKSDKYAPDTSEADAERFRIRSTNGRQRMTTYRPTQEEDNQSISNGEELPSYYEMIPPPLYKNVPAISVNGDNSSSLRPSNDVNRRSSDMTEIDINSPSSPSNEINGSNATSSPITLPVTSVNEDYDISIPRTDETAIDMTHTSLPAPDYEEFVASERRHSGIQTPPPIITVDSQYATNSHQESNSSNPNSSTLGTTTT